MIVKIQLPLASSEDSPPALLYNKDRSILIHIAPSAGLVSKMKGRPKAFFNADVINGSIEICEEAPWQEW